MGSLDKKKKEVINPNDISTRDYLMVDIINGATKSYVEIDRKKQNSKNSCRKWNKRNINHED